MEGFLAPDNAPVLCRKTPLKSLTHLGKLLNSNIPALLPLVFIDLSLIQLLGDQS